MVSEQYLLTGMRYFEFNPVRAGMISHPKTHWWSSYRSNTLSEENAMLSSHSVYKRLGANRVERQKAYPALFKRRLGEQTLQAVRKVTNKAWVLGNN